MVTTVVVTGGWLDDGSGNGDGGRRPRRVLAPGLVVTVGRGEVSIGEEDVGDGVRGTW